MDTAAHALLAALTDAGVTACFTNPGTSEMHVVAALDDHPDLRPILCLFEGVATGAADGYGRVAGRPAATLLHLGPGLANGLANLHNARRARTPIVNVVGDHATHHQRYDAPLQSDLDALARTVSVEVLRVDRPEDLAAAATDAVRHATAAPGGVVTVVVPADVAWSPIDAATPPAASGPAHTSPAASAAHTGATHTDPAHTSPAPASGHPVTEEAVRFASCLLADHGERCGLLIGGRIVGDDDALRLAAKVAAHTGARLLCETFPARQRRGVGLPDVERVSYLAELAALQLAELTHLVVLDTTSPVAFFAAPDQPSTPLRDGCIVEVLATGAQDPIDALERLAAELGPDHPAAATTTAAAPATPPSAPPSAPPSRPDRPTGPLDVATLAAAIGATLPDDAIIVDESITSGLFVPGATAACPPHDWLYLTGGSIGFGLPTAVGAAVAAPDRRVLAIQADGSAMYTIQALWTMAREHLDVTVVLADNAKYSILEFELLRVGAQPGSASAEALMSLANPRLDFASLAAGMGVAAHVANTAEAFTDALAASFTTPGPTLIVARLAG